MQTFSLSGYFLSLIMSENFGCIGFIFCIKIKKSYKNMFTFRFLRSEIMLSDSLYSFQGLWTEPLFSSRSLIPMISYPVTVPQMTCCFSLNTIHFGFSDYHTMKLTQLSEWLVIPSIHLKWFFVNVRVLTARYLNKIIDHVRRRDKIMK